MTEPGDGGRGPARGGQWWVAAVLLALAVVGFSVLLGAHQRGDGTFDRTDEQAHYDYVVALSHGHVPVYGDLYSQETLRAVSCLGVDRRHRHGCAPRRRDPRGYAPHGYSYEAQQPPLAYLPYVMVADPAAGPARALADARRGGEIWTVVGAGLLLAVAAVEGLTLVELAGLLAICLVGPLAVYASATVTNDSAAIAAGALAILMTSWAPQRRGVATGVGTLVGVVIGLLKSLFLVAPFVLLLAALLTDRTEHRAPRGGRAWARSLRDRHGAASGMCVGAAAAYVGWVVLQAARATTPPSTVLHALLGFSTTARPRWQALFEGLQQQLSPLGGPRPTPLDAVWNLSVLGTVGALALLRPRGPARWRATALAVLVGLAVMAVAVPLLDFSEGHYDFYAPARYGLPVLPIVALVAVRSVRRGGLVAIGVALPLAAGLDQLLHGHL